MTNEINLDIILIKLFTSKDYYTKYKSYISKYLINNYKTNNKLLYKLYRCLELLQEERGTASLEDILLRLNREYPALPSDERELASETLQKAAGATYQEAEVEGYIKTHYERSKASDVAIKALQVVEGKASIQELSDAIGTDVLEEEQEKAEALYYQADLEALFVSTKGKNGLRWPLMSLNKSLGSLRPGDFGFFFARPEVGKTTFLSHVVTHMVPQVHRPCLWINNEEGGNKVLLRCYQSFLGATSNQLFKDRAGCQEKFKMGIGDNLKLVNDPTLDYKRVEKLVAESRPCLVVIDQLDKLLGFDAERNDLVLKMKYQWAREIAKKYECAVIAVCQAGGTAENKKKLVMTDVDSSHTAKQGEADWILGFGKVDQEGLENVRYINVIKNKLVGDEDSVNEMRHGFFDVLIEPEIGRYKDRIDWK